MALPISPKLEQAFTPPGAEGDPPPVYRFFPPTLRDREKWRARLESLGGAVIPASRLRAIVESGLKALCSEPSDVETLLAVWDLAAERETAAREVGERLSAAASAAPGDEAAVAPFLAELRALELSPAEQDQLAHLLRKVSARIEGGTGVAAIEAAAGRDPGAGGDGGGVDTTAPAPYVRRQTTTRPRAS